MGKRKEKGGRQRKGIARVETILAFPAVPKPVGRVLELAFASLLALLLYNVLYAVYEYVWVDRQEMQQRIDALEDKTRFLRQERQRSQEIFLYNNSNIFYLNCSDQGGLPSGTVCLTPGKEGPRMQGGLTE